MDGGGFDESVQVSARVPQVNGLCDQREVCRCFGVLEFQGLEPTRNAPFALRGHVKNSGLPDTAAEDFNPEGYPKADRRKKERLAALRRPHQTDISPGAINPLTM